MPYLVLAWLLGVFGLSLWHLGGWAQLQRLKRQMVEPVADDLRTKVRALAERLRVRRVVAVVQSALVQVPTVIGWLKPVILLPASALSGLSPEHLEALLAHELAHIRRHDYLVNMFQTVIEILGFYHPAVWWTSRRIRVERENCCDDMAVGLAGDRVLYADDLATMEELRSPQRLALAASGGNLFTEGGGATSKASYTKEELRRHLREYNMEAIRQGLPTLALPSTVEKDRQRVEESVPQATEDK